MHRNLKIKDMYETAKERYEKTLTAFEESLRHGRATKLSDVCRDNRVYYRGMLKWLYKSGRTLADIRKGIKTESSSTVLSGSQSSFVEMAAVPMDSNGISSSHKLDNIRLNLGSGVSLSIEAADAGALAEFVAIIMKETGICLD